MTTRSCAIGAPRERSFAGESSRNVRIAIGGGRGRWTTLQVRVMADHGADTEEATAVVRWLLESGVRGLGLTKTHALQLATVREAAARWPHWWKHELFGPPHREADLRVLEATHGGLRRLRLMRRRRETLHTTARGRQLLADSDALLEAQYAAIDD
jgi:hypothetical protein